MAKRRVEEDVCQFFTGLYPDENVTRSFLNWIEWKDRFTHRAYNFHVYILS